MRSFLNYLAWGFLVVFALPTVMVIGTWNSLPGDSLYGIKLGMEQALLVLVSPSLNAQGTLSIKYTERRFSENKRLLADKGSVEGLQYLDKQVVATKDIIVKGNNAVEQAALAQQYIDTLRAQKSELEAQKQSIATGTTTVVRTQQPVSVAATSVPTRPPTPTPTRPPFVPTPTRAPYAISTPTRAPTATPVPTHPPTPTPVPPQQTQQPQQQVEVVVDQIQQSQNTIDDTINELEDIAKGKKHEKDNDEKQRGKGNKE